MSEGHLLKGFVKYQKKDCHLVKVVGMLHHAHSYGEQHVLL